MIRYFEVGTLYSFYKDLLTKKQARCVDLYYNNDLTMQEVAEELGISKQAVSLTVKKAVQKLDNFEEKLNFARMYYLVEETKDGLKNIIERGKVRGDLPEDFVDEVYILLSNLEKMGQ